MPTCFVIQPFDKGKFDERFRDIYKPALEEAGLEVYRVDEGLQRSGADSRRLRMVLENRPFALRISLQIILMFGTNLGYASAVNRIFIMICSSERQEAFPFDIQHRAVINYSPDSPSGFEKLKSDITAKAKALLENSDALQQVKESEQTTQIEGLSPLEIMVLTTLVSETAVPRSVTHLSSLKHDIRLAGITSIGFGLAIRSLIDKEFVNLKIIDDQDIGRTCRL